MDIYSISKGTIGGSQFTVNLFSNIAGVAGGILAMINPIGLGLVVIAATV